MKAATKEDISRGGRLVYGVGIYKGKEFYMSHNGDVSQKYTLWTCMLQRCYGEIIKRLSPTYKDCSISENFKDFGYFSKWCDEQFGFGLDGYELDKDLLFYGNKTYSEDICVFIPRQLNTILLDTAGIRGEWPIGVSFDGFSGKFKATISKFGKQRTIGRFASPEEAFNAYKKEKEIHVKEVAEKYKESIDPRVYRALIDWKVKA